MKILEVKSLGFPEVKIITYGRFPDERGYFAEVYRKSDFDNHPDTGFVKGVDFLQCNVSFSHKGVIRGMHFQWDPYMDKLVRVVEGKMVDLILDIRKGSPNFGKMIAYELSAHPDENQNEWIWIPKGFAHGAFYLEETFIEYFCTSEWKPTTEASISPLAPDIDWSFCETDLKKKFDEIVANGPLISIKDRDGYTVKNWEKDPNSKNFTYSS